MKEPEKKTELEDLSSPFNPNLQFSDSSKEFLLKLMGIWQYAWLHSTEARYYSIAERFGTDVSHEREVESWVKMRKMVNPRHVNLGKIELRTVLDSLKDAQLGETLSAVSETRGNHFYRMNFFPASWNRCLPAPPLTTTSIAVTTRHLAT